MFAGRLFIKLTVFYLAVTGLVLALSALIPGFHHYLPIGGAENLLSGPADDPFEGIAIGASRVDNLVGSILWLVIATVGALVTVLPVSWTYMACRHPREYDQSLVETMLILPVLVTSIVILVHDSLALAFSLAGIVGGVRFRNTLKSSGDALYILLAIAIGLSAGIGAIEVALVVSLVFNYLFLILWVTDYGGLSGSHRYLRARRPEDEVEEIDWAERPFARGHEAEHVKHHDGKHEGKHGHPKHHHDDDAPPPPPRPRMDDEA